MEKVLRENIAESCAHKTPKDAHVTGTSNASHSLNYTIVPKVIQLNLLRSL